MSEVEKMYENVGIEKEFEKPAECAKNPYITCNGCMLYDDKKGKCNNKKEYPPFTAEKQLELIKLLCKETYRNYLLIRYNFTNYFWQIECNMTDSDKLDNFAETLASMINHLWQDLTDQEKTEIAEILRG